MFIFAKIEEIFWTETFLKHINFLNFITMNRYTFTLTILWTTTHFYFCTGHRWRNTKYLFVFCEGFLNLFGIICESQYVSHCQQQSYSGLRSCDNHAQPTVWYCFMVLCFCFMSSVSSTGSTDVNAQPPICKSFNSFKTQTTHCS